MVQAVSHLSPNNYTPVGDLTVVAICLVIYALIAFSYVRKTAAFRTFMCILPCLMLSAMLDVSANTLVNRLGSAAAVYVLNCLFHAALFMLFFLFTVYIVILARLDRKMTVPILSAAFALWAVIVCVNVFSSIRSFSAGESLNEYQSSTHLFFLISYLLYAAGDVILMAAIHRRLYRRVMWGFFASVTVSFSILLIQRLFGGGSSFTVATFLFPVIAMFYIIHSNLYDAETGTVDKTALMDIVRYSYEKKQDFVFISLFLPAFSADGNQMSESIRALVRRFSSSFFRGALLFQLGNGHLFLLFRKNRNPDYEHRIERILKAFRDYHRVYQHDYKIVIGESIDRISRKNNYTGFLRSIHRDMPVNTIHRVSPADLAAFDRSEYILQALTDIHNKHDLNDSRILVYCQPVFNIATERYDTAEALMRLQLDDLGLVCPEHFIYLAEEHGYIHTLTEIILHKTCEEIRKLVNAGYDFTRISVNVSMMEFKSEFFCEDVSDIISTSGISGDKVAIELTESQSENEFDVMKAKITELKEQGIKFYLDDFGTGYSNMERIIELPFDIIKFDRSLVTASSSSKRSEKIVHQMAALFRDLNYSVLYEGVESDQDEILCREMSASYLQGYKFSQPIPIADLRHFFLTRKNRAG